MIDQTTDEKSNIITQLTQEENSNYSPLENIMNDHVTNRCTNRWTHYFDIYNPTFMLSTFTGYDSRKIYALWYIYHLFNVIACSMVFIAHPPNKINKWCTTIDVNILLLQFQSLFMYVFAIWIMSNKSFIDDGHMSITYSSSFKIIPNIFMWFTIMLIWISEFVQVIDSTSWALGAQNDWLEWILFIFDFFRFTQCVVIALYVYGYLKKFENEFEIFIEGQIENTFKKLIEPISVDDINLEEFRLSYYKTKKLFIDFMDKFKFYLICYGLFNLLSLTLIIIAIIKSYYGIGCNITGTYFFHFTSEIVFFVGYWLFIMYKLNRNYHIFEDYLKKFTEKVSFKNNQYKQQEIRSFFEYQLLYSPFAICGVNPSNTMFKSLLCAFVIPMIINICQYYIV